MDSVDVKRHVCLKINYDNTYYTNIKIYALVGLLFFFLSLFFLKKPQLLPELHSLAVPHLYCPHAFNLLLQLQHSIQQCLGCGGTPCQIQTHIYINNNYLTHIRVCTHVTHIHTLSVSLSHMHTHTCMHTPKHTCI